MSEEQDIQNRILWLPPAIGEDKLILVRKIDLGFNEVGFVYEVVGTRWHPKPMYDVGFSDLLIEEKSSAIDWDAQPLGKVPDGKLAEKLDVHPATVSRAKKERKVAPVLVPLRPDDSVDDKQPLDPHEIDWNEQPLGEVLDSVLAESLGIDVRIVTEARSKRKIPKCAVNWDEQPLGKQSDTMLAKKLGVARSSVSRARRARKIPAWQNQKKKR